MKSKYVITPIIIVLFSHGGIEAYTSDGKIKIVNTLEARLDMLFSQVMFTS